MTDEMEKELVAAVEQSVREVTREPIPLRANVPASLPEQMQQLERISLEMDKRLRRAAVEARIEAEHKIGMAQADFERQLSEETARLERERNEMLRQAQDELHKKLHDLAAMARRRPA